MPPNAFLNSLSALPCPGMWGRAGRRLSGWHQASGAWAPGTHGLQKVTSARALETIRSGLSSQSGGRGVILAECRAGSPGGEEAHVQSSLAHPPSWREEEVPAGWRRYRLEKQIKPRNRYLAWFWSTRSLFKQPRAPTLASPSIHPTTSKTHRTLLGITEKLLTQTVPWWPVTVPDYNPQTDTTVHEITL